MKLRLYLLDRNVQWEIQKASEVETELTSYDNIYYQIMDIQSWSVYEYICEKLREGKKLYLPKQLQANDIDISDIIVVEPDSELETHRQQTILKIRDYIMSTRLTKLSLINVFKFIILTNWMWLNNIIITDENREEKYLEWVTKASELAETDPDASEKLINRLETYLDSYDKLSYAESIITGMEETINNIENAESIEEIDQLYNDYIVQFN